MSDPEEDWSEEDVAAILNRDADLRPSSETPDALQDLVKKLRADPDLPCSNELTQRIVEAATPARHRYQPILALAAAIVLLLCTVLMFERGPKQRQLAINGGIDWLVSQQGPDGQWDPSQTGGHATFTRGVTALSLMALLDSGRTARYAETIQAARDALMQTTEAPAPHQAYSYNECLATLALLELHKQQPDEQLHHHIDQSLSRMVQRQNANGGWGYQTHGGFSYQGDAPANSSMTLWPLLTLEQAVEQGWTPLETPLLKARNWMALQMDEDGYLGYRRPGDHPKGPQTLLAIGLLGLPEAAADQRGKLKKNFLAGRTKRAEGMDYYRGFIAARALRDSDEPRSDLQHALLALQAKDGSWPAGQHWNGTGGRIGATALASLSLSAD